MVDVVATTPPHFYERWNVPMFSRSMKNFLAVVIVTAAIFIGLVTLPEFRIEQVNLGSELAIAQSSAIAPIHIAQSNSNQAPSQPARRRPEDTWEQVYRRLPNLPRENQYINRELREVRPNNTLVSRMIRYHVYIKARPVNYRLDWKLTLADYLGANELIDDRTYPGADTLDRNPLDGDRAIIQKLNRAQRDELVQVLVDVFSPRVETPAASPASSIAPSPTRTPTAPTVPERSREPRPGDAQLLR